MTEAWPSFPLVQARLAQLADAILQQPVAKLASFQIVQPPVEQLITFEKHQRPNSWNFLILFK